MQIFDEIILNNNLLSNLTLVVPTYRRQSFALRLMDYWSNKGPEILIIDGSPEPIDRELISKYSNNIRYVHQPEGMYIRLATSLKLITTEFVALAGDDEFYIPSALESSLKKLNNDNELVACCGRSIGFKVDNKKILGFSQYDNFADFDLDSKYPEERVTKHMSNYAPRYVYAICRKSAWTKVWENILSKEFAFYAAGEIQFELCMSIAGKSLVLPELMWLRSYGESEEIQSFDPSLNPKIRINSWWFDERNKVEKMEFIKAMSQTLKDVSYKGDCQKILEHSILAYINNNIKSNKVAYLELLKTLFIVRFRALFFKFTGLFWHKKYNVTLRDKANMLYKSGVIVNFESLGEIEQIISKHHHF